ncbi:Type IV pilus biogenesis factor PilY1 [Thalassocella blandensis]|nr:Type IV pilus biogenesis factor PilY1 [Thalassocella blandensis]
MSSLKTLNKAITFSSVLLCSCAAFAAPGELSNKPLFLGTSVQPNILFLMDDSGSMDWEVLLSNGAEDAHSGSRNDGNLDFAPGSSSRARELCVGYNVMAYDPSKSYTPWKGTDKDDLTFLDQPVNSAYSNAYRKDGATDLRNHFYIEWKDSNSDNYYQNGECDVTGATASSSAIWTTSGQTTTYVSDTFTITTTSTLAIDIGAENLNQFENSDYFRAYAVVNNGPRIPMFLQNGGFNRQTVSTAVSGSTVRVEIDVRSTQPGVEIYNLFDIIVDGSGRDICPSCVYVNDMSVEEQINYANWFTYYRKREFVAKRALSEIMSEGRSRMGLASLHNNNSIGTIIKDIDDISSGDLTAAANKRALLKNLAKISSNGGTPLRQTLEEAGDYFEVGVSPGSGLFGFNPSPSSPILSAANGGACQQNFSVLLSDGYWNGGSPSVGNADGVSSSSSSSSSSGGGGGSWEWCASEGGFCSFTGTTTVAYGYNRSWHMETKTDGTDCNNATFGDPYPGQAKVCYYWDDPANSSSSSSSSSGGAVVNFDGGSYADSYSNTLADVAMHYYERDLAPLLQDTVPVTAGIDTNTQQHMVTFTVAFGINGTLDANPPNRTDPFPWPEARADSPEAIDDMRHAAWNGRGEFLNAANPQELIDSLGSSLASIQDRTGSASAVAFNTTSITAETYVYQARFDSGNWSGQLLAYEYDDDGLGSLRWDAGKLLSAETLDWTTRNIYTYRDDTNKGIPFAFPADYTTRLVTAPDDSELNSTQIADLLANAPFGLNTIVAEQQTANTEYGVKVVNYLKGDFTNDGAFRNRQGKRLGDIVHSSPEFVGEPNQLYPDRMESSSYFSFVSNNASRTPVIYVGANDGMLHAFHATDGNELFGYIPGTLFSAGDTGLHKLTETDYGHIPYVDASPTSRDVFVGGQWKTYLVGGFRAGGKGVYVLDVTDPDDYTTVTDVAADKLSVMEFTHNDLGYTFSNPQIAKLNNGKWAAIFGNGYNNDPTGDGTAKLFMLYLDGSGYKMLETKVGSMTLNDCANLASDCNGLSSPSLIDTNSDFIVDRIYAGDLQGNMWVFDVSDSNDTNWKTAFGSTLNPAPLFTACSSAICTSAGRPVNRQPITSKPMAIAHPTATDSRTNPNVMVLFGTGQYITTTDNTDGTLQSFYGVWDAGNAYGNLTRTNLVEQTMTLPENEDLLAGRVLSTNPVSYNPIALPVPEMGWFIDLKEPDGAMLGERVVVDPIVSGGYVFFNTTIPNNAVCSAGGSGYLMVADIKTGGQPNQAVFRSYNLGDTPQDLENAYAGIPLNAVPGGATLINGNKVVVSDSLGRIVTADFNPPASNKNSRRSSWSVVK